MKIIIEDHVPYIRGVFEPECQTVYLPAKEITAETVKNADALITRTRTRCDAHLLEGSRCRIVATATIGTDHIDTGWCRNAGIEVANVPGCNAPAVAQYVMASLLRIFTPDELKAKTIGVIGVGHVGSIVVRWAEGLGMKVLLNDPPREAAGETGFTSLDHIMHDADIITFHTPLTKPSDSVYPTFHLADSGFFSRLSRRPVIINAARGPILDSDALLEAISSGKVSAAVIDCWEGEPAVNLQLLKETFIATPHIAGYSRAGKIRATMGVISAVNRCLGLHGEYRGDLPPDVPVTVTAEEVAESYNPVADSDRFKNNPSEFEKYRNEYDLRREVRE